MVATLGPNCSSTCTLNCCIKADLNFGASATKERAGMPARLAMLGAEGVGSPTSKVVGAPVTVAQLGFCDAGSIPLACSIGIARADWQLGLKTDVNGAFFRSAFDV